MVFHLIRAAKIIYYLLFENKIINFTTINLMVFN